MSFNEARQTSQNLERSLSTVTQKLEKVEYEYTNLQQIYERTSGSKISQESIIHSMESKINALTFQMHDLEIREKEAIENDKKISEKYEFIQSQMVL